MSNPPPHNPFGATDAPGFQQANPTQPVGEASRPSLGATGNPFGAPSQGFTGQVQSSNQTTVPINPPAAFASSNSGGFQVPTSQQAPAPSNFQTGQTPITSRPATGTQSSSTGGFNPGSGQPGTTGPGGFQAPSQNQPVTTPMPQSNPSTGFGQPTVQSGFNAQPAVSQPPSTQASAFSIPSTANTQAAQPFAVQPSGQNLAPVATSTAPATLPFGNQPTAANPSVAAPFGNQPTAANPSAAAPFGNQPIAANPSVVGPFGQAVSNQSQPATSTTSIAFQAPQSTQPRPPSSQPASSGPQQPAFSAAPRPNAFQAPSSSTSQFAAPTAPAPANLGIIASSKINELFEEWQKTTTAQLNDFNTQAKKLRDVESELAKLTEEEISLQNYAKKLGDKYTMMTDNLSAIINEQDDLEKKLESIEKQYQQMASAAPHLSTSLSPLEIRESIYQKTEVAYRETIQLEQSICSAMEAIIPNASGD